MRIDVFTLVPHAYSWLTEQQPVAGVLGTELELRLFNYRDSTPLRAGQVDDGSPPARRGAAGVGGCAGPAPPRRAGPSRAARGRAR